MKHTETSVRDIVNDFAVSTKNNSITDIEYLLCDEGYYEIQLENLETFETNKTEFLQWFSNKLNTTIITDVEFDQCIHCAVGNNVLLFNKGLFPRTVKDASERSKTGLMIGVTDGVITQIKFCYVFMKTDNKYAFECQIDDIKALMKAEGISFHEAQKRM